jgi:protein ImuA
MPTDKSHILARLQKDILTLQGFKKAGAGSVNIGWGKIDEAFPNQTFPLGAVHEFLCSTPENASSTCGFIGGILSALMAKGGACIWISSARKIFPPAFKFFGIEPDKIIFIDLSREKEIAWAMEEALKCNGLAAVIGEMSDLSFTTSRRLQLAVENSRVTGFVIRNNIKQANTSACVTRWQISPLPSGNDEGMPGIGFSRWKVELLKVRNGVPGTWILEWRAARFRHITPVGVAVPDVQRRKVS